MAVQLDLFEDTSDISLLRKELEDIRSSHNNMRKAYFAKLHEMGKMCISQTKEIEKLKKILEDKSQED